MDFERTFWDEQTPITPQELNRIESGIESLYKRFDIEIYYGRRVIEEIELGPKEAKVYKISCPGSRPQHIALASYPGIGGIGVDTLLLQARAQHDEVEVRIENISDNGFRSINAMIYVVVLNFKDLYAIWL